MEISRERLGRARRAGSHEGQLLHRDQGKRNNNIMSEKEIRKKGGGEEIVTKDETLITMT